MSYDYFMKNKQLIEAKVSIMLKFMIIIQLTNSMVSKQAIFNAFQAHPSRFSALQVYSITFRFDLYLLLLTYELAIQN